MKRKYELTNETIEVNGKTLHRIKALTNLDEVDEGSLGGYIEKEENLSHDGQCWIFDNAKVYGNAKVIEDALVYDNAEVYDNAILSEQAYVYDNTKIFGNAKLGSACDIRNNAQIFGDVIIEDGANIVDDAFVSSNDDYKMLFISILDLCITIFKEKDGNVGTNFDYQTDKYKSTSISRLVEFIKDELSEIESDECYF